MQSTTRCTVKLSTVHCLDKLSTIQLCIYPVDTMAEDSHCTTTLWPEPPAALSSLQATCVMDRTTHHSSMAGVVGLDILHVAPQTMVNASQLLTAAFTTCGHTFNNLGPDRNGRPGKCMIHTQAKRETYPRQARATCTGSSCRISA